MLSDDRESENLDGLVKSIDAVSENFLSLSFRPCGVHNLRQRRKMPK